VKRNLLALVTPLNPDNLKFLTGDGRPNVVIIFDSYSSAAADAFLKKMKVAAQANRDFVFSSVVASEWPKFVRPFALGKKPVLPTVIIWDKQFYAKVSHSERAFYLTPSTSGPCNRTPTVVSKSFYFNTFAR